MASLYIYIYTHDIYIYIYICIYIGPHEPTRNNDHRANSKRKYASCHETTRHHKYLRHEPAIITKAPVANSAPSLTVLANCATAIALLSTHRQTSLTSFPWKQQQSKESPPKTSNRAISKVNEHRRGTCVFYHAVSPLCGLAPCKTPLKNN